MESCTKKYGYIGVRFCLREGYDLTDVIYISDWIEHEMPNVFILCPHKDDLEKWYADLKGNIYDEFQISDKCVRCINPIQAQKVASEGKFPVIRIAARPVDFITEYEFTRYKIINGKENNI